MKNTLVDKLNKKPKLLSGYRIFLAFLLFILIIGILSVALVWQAKAYSERKAAL